MDRMLPASRWLKLTVWCCLLFATAAVAESAAQPIVPGPGALLVASPRMPDKDWANAVILIVYSDGQGVMGVLLNRPTKFPVSHLFPDLRSTPAGKEPVYFGGLVASGARAVVRSKEMRKGAQRLFGEVSVLLDSNAVEKAARSGLRGNAFRIYAGYAGWSPAQLRHEVLQGNWRVLPANVSLVFDPHPATLWRRLAARR